MSICNNLTQNDKNFKDNLNQRLKNLNWPYLSKDDYKSILTSQNNNLVIDVSDSLEYYFEDKKYENMNFIHIPLNDLMQEICKVNLDDYKKIIFICTGAPKSAVAASMLRMFGYDNSFFLAGGIMGLKADVN